ncbi:hypothetical protein [Ruicaihuangia caeni]|uniref:hypothetical protein n=1 Tax=Ruicaihuangia caeni TaxID=3042517 RepID=UPI00338E646A
MSEKTSQRDSGDGFVRMTDWLNEKLLKAFGPPPLGPYDDTQESDVVQRMGNATCPLCDHPMSEHFIDHSTSNAKLLCPVDHKPVHESMERLNEVGMPKRAKSDEAD